MKLKKKVQEFEKELILAQLKQSDSALEAAKALGIPRATLYRKMAQYGIKINREVVCK